MRQPDGELIHIKTPWVPEYTTAKGTPYSPDDVAFDECPVSFISARSHYVVSAISQARMVRESSGAVFGGSDSGKWPAKYFDAVTIIESQQRNERAAFYEALKQDPKD